ncbi:acyltransferase family protein [Fodinibius sediminis]|uniref:Predicted acyltransferase n=1 Tax=Fodinibius sediminis TaxID=1214077 RepID=A0A521BVY8_9BACT|nr:heparan-alpha-glucosaminide N-acetyltransferase domain-containing protein [Fodinibius sediminis]SMO50590.1 Predicted acyltransferase [Fodinibius sediminis]
MADKPLSKRLISLDFFRGLTIIGMIIVNTPGAYQYTFAPLKHAEWNGATPTDYVFPFFIFIVGVSIVLAYTKYLSKGRERGAMVPKIIKRSLIIFGLGLFLNVFPEFDFANIRIPGVLQRIAIVFFACALLFLYTSRRTQWWLGGALLVGYWLMIVLIPHPGEGLSLAEPGKNIAAWIDSTFIPGRLYQGTWDPEGILSTLPAIATGMTGMIAGYLIVSDRTREQKVVGLMVGGFVAFVLGNVWNWFFPINKHLWTSSYVLHTSGLASMVLGACYYWIDVLGKSNGTFAGVVFGTNAITAYVISGILPIVTHSDWLGDESLRSLFMNGGVSAGINPFVVSLLWALFFCFLCYIPVYFLYKNKIFIKV